MKYLLIIIAILAQINRLTAQEINAVRINESITIDGLLDEDVWKKTKEVTGFTTVEPSYNATASLQPNVKMLYDDKKVYFGVFIPTVQKSDIKTELSARDKIGNTDWFLVLIDTYGNGTSGVEFMVTAAGVQFDATTGTNGEDANWDAVWDSKVTIKEGGWYAEIAIPYAALRFPKSKVQPWKINFVHRCVANGEQSTYFPINPEIAGFVNQTARVTGIENIKSPMRLSLTPYFTSYYTTNKDRDGKFTDGFNVSGGMDLKYGINDAFTLDMTLVPDFGQVKDDDNTLNLSPFELQFSENRPFFTEGLELFNRANIFYTRRIGGRPIGFGNSKSQLTDGEKITANPINTRLVNATKISGRTKSGWGLGFLNAISRKTFADVENTLGESRRIETSPLTNYNVTVVDKNLPHNSYISLINTNVTRFNSDYHNANVTGAEVNLRMFDENVGLVVKSSLSNILNKNLDNQVGYKFSSRLSKISGNFNYGISASGTSKDYDNNDLGFNARTNVTEYSPSVSYSFNDGLWFFSVFNTWAGYQLYTRYEDQKIIGQNYNAGLWGRTKNRWRYNLWANYNTSGYDQFEARKDGQLLEMLEDVNVGMYISSDPRKKFRLETYFSFLEGFQKGYYFYDMGLNPRYRISDKLTIAAGLAYKISKGSRNYVDRENNTTIIGLRDRNTVTNTIRISYTVNSKMSLSSRVRHYWTKVTHSEYYDLQKDGSLKTSSYDKNAAYTYNGLNINTEFRWRFAPGSDIVAVWQNNTSGSDNFDPQQNEIDYRTGLKSLSKLNQNNSFSIRILYFLDAGKML